MFRKFLKAILPSPLRRALLRWRYGRFYVLQQETEGLLVPTTYEEIHRRVLALPDLDIVEIGGAAGTATIAMGWAMAESGKRSKLVVVEKCEGGSREKFGGRKENLDRIVRNLRSYGIEDRVILFPHYMTFENGAEVVALVKTPQIAALVIDADGHIHRDFHFFWPRLAEGGLIIIDDYHPDRSPKHALTYHLLNLLRDWRLIEDVQVIHETVFARKGPGPFENLNIAEAQRVAAETCRQLGVVFDERGVTLH